MSAETATTASPTERAWTRPDQKNSTQTNEAKILKFPEQKGPNPDQNKENILTKESAEKPANLTEPRSNQDEQPQITEAKEETRINQLTGKLKEVTHAENLAAKVETLWNQTLEHQKWLRKAVEMMRNHRAITGALVGVAIFQLEAITNVPIPPELMARLTAGGVGAAAGYIASPEGKIGSTIKGAALGLGVGEVLTQTKGDEVIQKTAGKVLPFSGLGKVLGSFVDDLPLLLSTRRKVK